MDSKIHEIIQLNFLSKNVLKNIEENEYFVYKKNTKKLYKKLNLS